MNVVYNCNFLLVDYGERTCTHMHACTLYDYRRGQKKITWRTSSPIFEELINVPCDVFNRQKVGVPLIAFLKSLNAVERTLYLKVFELAKLILVMPATNAISERSFSTLRRLKTWLRNSINQNRLNRCTVLHVLKTETDLLKQTGNEFISRNLSRQHFFWPICVLLTVCIRQGCPLPF